MACGEDLEQAIRTLQRVLFDPRLEGVRNNVPFLSGSHASKEFANAGHHAGPVPQCVNKLRQRNLANQSGRHWAGGAGHLGPHEPGIRRPDSPPSASLPFWPRSTV